MNLHSKENSRGPRYIEVKLTETFATFREKLVTILNGQVSSVSITLRSGRTIEIGGDPSEILITSRWRSGLAGTTSN
jgi:hypothetical protein